jgi:hypothetical protein
VALFMKGTRLMRPYAREQAASGLFLSP